MLVCPVCHHELPLPSMPATIKTSPLQESSLRAPAMKGTTCDLKSNTPLCHVTPASSLGGVTSSCGGPANRLSCHVFPYSCSCSLNHGQQQHHNSNTLMPPLHHNHHPFNHSHHHHHRTSLPSNALFLCSQQQTPAATPLIGSANSFSSINNSGSHFRTNNQYDTNKCSNIIDLSNLKVSSNLTSCPTSPLPSTIVGCNNGWSSGHGLFQPHSTCCSKQQTNSPCCSETLLQCPDEASHSLPFHQQQHLCMNQSSCNNCSIDNKPDYRRQSSCPNNTSSCLNAATSSCKCNEQTPLHRTNSTTNPFFPASVDSHCQPHSLSSQQNHHPCSTTTITTSTTTTLLQPHNHQLTTQIELQYSDHSDSTHFQQGGSDSQPKDGSNIVILNSTGGGGFIFERKMPSRSNSPELKFTVSLPSSIEPGHRSPNGSVMSSNTVSFDRETLLQTLASLPPVSSASRSSFDGDNSFSSFSSLPCDASNSSFSTSHSTASTVKLGCDQHTQSSRTSSSSSSPISFQVPTTLVTSADGRSSRDVFSHHHNNTGNEMTLSTQDGRIRLNVRNVIIPSPVCERLPATPPKAVDEWTSEDDARILRNARTELEESGFYYGGLTWRDANDVLSGASEGSFLVRDSFSGRCLYALSIKTAVGPTSVRIEYERGKFMLQSENRMKEGVPQRSCVVGLVQAYTETFNPGDVWVDHSGRTVSAISVTKPLRKEPASLQHLARLAYHREPQRHSSMYRTLPSLIRAYISSYSHTC